MNRIPHDKSRVWVQMQTGHIEYNYQEQQGAQEGDGKQTDSGEAAASESEPPAVRAATCATDMLKT